MKRFMIYTGFILLLLFGGVGQVQAVTKIDTTPYWDGSSDITQFGYTGTATYGQVVTVPKADAVLETFSFHMNLPAACTFRGYVYAWDGTKAKGAALYESPTMATTGSGTLEKIEFKTGGITLTPGARYVLFASVSKDSGSGGGAWGYTRSDTYSGGTFVFQNNGTTTEWTTAAWTAYRNDLAFTATFGPSKKILYWNDLSHGTDQMKEALVNVANTYFTSTTTATDLADFESKVAKGGWDLIVLAIQNFDHNTPNFNNYVSRGGRAILADWTGDATRSALFGVTYTGSVNQDVVTITDAPLLNGVTSPMSLTNPGWGSFSMGMTATSGAVAATFANGDAAIVVGEDRRTIVNGFLTDTPASASDALALFQNEILSVLGFKILSPNGGEKVPAGGVFSLTWQPIAEASFNIDLSTNGGSSWKPIATQYADSTYEWWVPPQKDNMPNCKIRVTGYDSYGVKVAQDESDGVFTIEVVGLGAPRGGEAWESGGTQSIVWTTHETMGVVESVQLFYTLDGKKWKPIATVAGNPGTYSWTVPTITASTPTCKVKAVLKSAAAGKGKTLGTAISEASFAIYP